NENESNDNNENEIENDTKSDNSDSIKFKDEESNSESESESDSDNNKDILDEIPVMMGDSLVETELNVSTLKEEIQRLLQKGLVVKSFSSWASSVV
ncbi:11603_t:CDS:2, partial [Diversispora eburnea]